jgi:hypothetical protein
VWLGCFTAAEVESNLMDPTNVKDYKVVARSLYTVATLLTSSVAKLNAKTQLLQSHLLEVRVVSPTLHIQPKYQDLNGINVIEITHLDSMEWVAIMDSHDTGTAHEFRTCAVNTTISETLSATTTMTIVRHVIPSALPTQKFGKECIAFRKPSFCGVKLEEAHLEWGNNEHLLNSHMSFGSSRKRNLQRDAQYKQAPVVVQIHR